MDSISTQSKNSLNINPNIEPRKKSAGLFIGAIVYVIIFFGISFFIGIGVFSFGAYIFNSRTELSNSDIDANIGGGLFLGAKELDLKSHYKFGEWDKAISGIHYVTNEFTTLYGMEFDKADVTFWMDYLEPDDFINLSRYGQIASISLEKRAPSKVLRVFVRDLISNIRKEAGLNTSGEGKFYNHYTLVLPHMVLEMKYEGFFLRHYVTLVVMNR